MDWGKVKILFWFFGVIVFTIAMFLFSHQAKAAADHIVINEIYPAPLSGEKEWVELYNPTSSDIDLSNYSLKDGGVAAKNLSGTITSGGYFVYEVSSGWLNNSGETLSLIYKSTSTTIDQVTYGDWNDNQDNQPPAPTAGRSLSRIPNGFDSDIDKSDFRVLAASKGLENLLSVYTNSIIINEILPQPATSSADEFIELYNLGAIDIDLSSWQLDDVAGSGSSAYTISNGTTIAPGGYLIFKNSQTKISLNDSGDQARLIDPNGEEKSAVNYPKSTRGQSYSKFGDNWQWTTTLTPGAANILTIEINTPDQDPPIVITDIIGARNQANGETVSVTGVVSVLPGTLSSQYFYIQDANAGIQIYCYNKSFPALQIGDEISVIGELSEYKNEKRLKISSALDIVILSNKSPPAPIQTTIDNLGENFEGRYIQVIGIVTKTSGDTFYISGSGEIQVLIREGTGIQKPKMHVGDKVLIAGILSHSGDSYRILPTQQDDVKIIKSSKLPKSGSEIWLYFISATIITILWSIFPKVCQRRKN